MYRLGLVDTLATHANTIMGFGQTSLSGVGCGFMPPQLKTKTVMFQNLNMPPPFKNIRTAFGKTKNRYPEVAKGRLVTAQTHDWFRLCVY